MVEGVPWYRYRVTFRTSDGKRHRLTHWSPGWPWVASEVGAALHDMHGETERASIEATCRIVEVAR
jgi:hypothetical protein